MYRVGEIMEKINFQLSAVPSKLLPRPEKNFHIGSLLLQAGYPEEALPWLERGAELNPSSPQLLNLGVCNRQLGNIHEASSLLERLCWELDFAQAWANFGMLLEDIGKFDPATAAYDRAHNLAPENPTIALNYAMCLLRNGEWQKAWPLWEYGRQPDLKLSNVPLWKPGNPSKGNSILIVPEGGYGDLIWLMRYFPMLKERGFKICLWTWDSLIPLLEHHPWIDTLIPASTGVSLVTEENTLRYDYQLPLMSIPAVLGIKGPEMAEPYLGSAMPWGVPPPDVLPLALRNKRIGLCWRAEETYTARKHRSLPDEAAVKMIESLPDVQFINLIFGADDIFGANRATWSMIPDTATWLETARIMHGCDLIISVDTAVAHLAGAMGLPCWLLLPMRSDWRWGLPEKRFEWYPGMRMFTQTDPISWSNVVEEVCQALKEL